MSGRIRTLKPEWLDDEKLAACEDASRLLSAGLILLADDQGNGRAHQLFLGSHVWPYGDPRETLAKVSRGLTELESIGFIRLYSVKKQHYFSIHNWSKHQRVDHPGKPRVPGPEHSDDRDPSPGSGGTPDGGANGSGESRESLAPDLRPVPPTTDLRSTTADRARAGARTHAGPRPTATATTESEYEAFVEYLWREWSKRYFAERGGQQASRQKEILDVARVLYDQAKADGLSLHAIVGGVLDMYWQEDWPRDFANRPSFGNLYRVIDGILLDLRTAWAEHIQARPA